MLDNPQVDALLEELHVSGRTPDEVCRACPELLPHVRAGWQRLRAFEAKVEALFPTSVDDAGPRVLPTNDLPRIDGYEVQDVLGYGGVGVVYKACHQRLNRAVALKMLIAGAYAHPEELERFRREAEAVASLRHANIVQVHDVGDLDGRPYFTMEFIEGGSLSEHLAGTPQPARAAAALVATVAEAVQVAHQSGIVHRDLKPANILLTADGTPKITDFGLARRLDGVEGLTLSGIPMGTPSYMAPEQAKGQRDAIGPATDVYALGGILYEMLTGRPPFRAETAAATIQQLLSQEPVPPSRLNSQVPRDLETICLKCLQKEPKKRYATAGELAADLERFLKNLPILARPIGPIERSLRWTQRHVGLTAALFGIGLLLASLVIGSLLAAAHFRTMEMEQRDLATAKGLLAEEKEKERENAVQAKRSEAALRKKAEQAERREAALHQQTKKQGDALRQSLYFAEMNLGGQAAMLPSGIGRVRDWLTPWENNRPDQPDQRDWEWYYLKGLCHRDLMTLQGHVKRVWTVAWSKDGRLASAGSDGTIRLWDTAMGQEVGCYRNKANVRSLAWSPDDKRLASAGGNGTVKVWDTATGKELVTFRGHAGDVFSVAWSPDGKRLASGGADNTIQVWGAEDGKVVHVFRGHVDAVSGVAWSVDGKTLASAGRDHAVRLWDTVAKKNGPILAGHVNWVNGVAWSHDGSRLASASNDLTVKVWDPAAVKELATLRGHTQGVKSVAWSPDGLRLVTSGEDQTVKIWQAAPSPLPLSHEGRGVGVRGSWDLTCTLRGHTAVSASAAWSFDGKRLASGGDDATVKIWDASSGPETRLLRGGYVAPVVSLAWHKDSQSLAASMDDTIRIWDTLQGKERAVLRGHEGRVLSAAWSPNGKWLASAGTDQVIRLWDTAKNTEAKSLHGHKEEIRSVAWSPDGCRLASAGMDKIVRIWDVQTGKEVQICRGHDMRVWSVAWSPDGKRLASASADKTVKVWNATNGQQILDLRVHEGEVTSVAWSPDGRWLASSGYDHTIKISNADTGKTLTLQGHTARVNALAWNPGSTRLASTGEDWTIKIWDAATGKVTLTLGDHAGGVYALTWSPDGYALASAGNDRTIVIHDAEAGYRSVRSPRYLAKLDQRLAVNAMNAADWRVRAEIHARLEEWDKAAADLQHYLKLQPDKRWYTLDCWVVGPYPEDLNMSYPPEKLLNPAQPVDGPGPGDAPALLHWKSVPLNAQGFVNFGPLFGNAEHISAYALLRVYSPVKQPVAILVGSDDYVRLSLNGKLIHEYLDARAAKADEDAVAGTLEPGWNTLLARVVNVTGAHALYWRLSDDPADLLRARNESRR